MKLGTEIGLGPGDIVLDGDPAPPQKGHNPPIFGPCLLRPSGLMDQHATWYEGRLGPGYIVLDGYPVPPPSKRGTAAPHFSAHVCCGQTAV